MGDPDLKPYMYGLWLEVFREAIGKNFSISDAGREAAAAVALFKQQFGENNNG